MNLKLPLPVSKKDLSRSSGEPVAPELFGEVGRGAGVHAAFPPTLA